MTTVGAVPVEAFLDALNRADLQAARATLAAEVVVRLPSLRGSLRGRDAVTAALEAVLVAFPDLRYASSSRYILPGQVTDEAVITGTRLGPWGELPPSGRPRLLPARVVVDHDGVLVTEVTVWADAASLRALLGDAGDVDRTSGIPIVTALRASIPSGDPRVFLGAPPQPVRPPAQQASPRSTPSQPMRLDELNPAAAKAAALKVPMPRRRRRTLAVTASLAMAAAAALIVTWVVRGALAQPGTGIAVVADASPTAAARPTTSQRASKAAAVAPTKAQPYTRKGNLYTFNADLTFERNSARLNAVAEDALRKIIDQVRAERRTGVLVVNGFTDADGTTRHNLRLSMARAEAVARVLRAGLGDVGITVRARGYGEDRPKAPNDTEAGKALNRRVEITVPGTAR